MARTLTLADRLIECGCGLTIDRDLNAAINIRRWGLDILVGMGYTKPVEKQNACGDTDFSRYVSMKQEKFLTIGQEATTL